MKGKEVSLHFEGAMGKQVIYLNGKRVQEHLGGYLPFTVQLTEQGVQPGDSCLLAVMTDNSDDKNFLRENVNIPWISLIMEEFTGMCG